MAKFERIDFQPRDWDKKLATFQDRNVFQTSAWLSFLVASQNGEPVLAALKEGESTLGYFAGMLVRKFKLKILGSPFRGWSSPYMGFNLSDSVSRRIAAEALPHFAFSTLGCMHLEVVDMGMKSEDLQGIGSNPVLNHTIEIDLTQTEDKLFENMSKTCRWSIRKAEKNGIVIEEAQDMGFADDYSNQLEDVFAKQGRVPHFGLERVRALIQHVHPTGTLLLLRARDLEGRCIATGIFPGMNHHAFFWGGASWREHQKLLPNELLQWHAMKYWKNRGIKSYNMVGTMEFKQKFGGVQTSVPLFSKSRYRVISQLRSSAPRITQGILKIGWKLKRFGRGKRAAS
ncbi:MAG: uncharacterized protein JWQ71_2743 [Pedosphaera sp.]|nr:uncharacterized protein [Pedosphaera sp.]